MTKSVCDLFDAYQAQNLFKITAVPPAGNPIAPGDDLEMNHNRLKKHGMDKLFSAPTFQMIVARNAFEVLSQARNDQPQDVAVRATNNTPTNLAPCLDISVHEIVQILRRNNATGNLEGTWRTSTYTRARMIAEFVNRTRQHPLPSRVPYIYVAQHDFYDRDTIDRHMEVFGRERGLDMWRRWALRIMRYAHSTLVFSLIEYYFIDVSFRRRPGEENAGEHHTSVFCISPANKTIEHLDSSDIPADPEIFDNIFYLLSLYLRSEFAPHEWKFRVNGSPKQRQSSDSGIHADANVMSLSLGYDLNYDTRPGYNIDNRRRRRACENLLGRFSTSGPASDYWYPIVTREFHRQSRFTSAAGAWRAINKRTLRKLPDIMRARMLAVHQQPEFLNLNTKFAIRAYCRAHPGMYPGVIKASKSRRVFLTEVEDWLLMRHLELEETRIGHRYP